jgi:hypothetical protein
MSNINRTKIITTHHEQKQKDMQIASAHHHIDIICVAKTTVLIDFYLFVILVLVCGLGDAH